MERLSISLSVSFAMVQVQRHECRPKKCFGKCEEGDPKVCRYGYPRERCDEDLGRSETTGRYIYRCEDKEDERLSPYIPLWLLATGARAVLLRVCGMQLVLAYTPTSKIQPSIIVPALKYGRMPTSPKQVPA